jgi:hypothetical protein
VNPRFPFYIPSRHRAEIALTPVYLDEIGVPYRLIVEADEIDAYAARFGEEKVLLLPRSYQIGFDSFDDLGESKCLGVGPARNFAWDHAIAEGADFHWVADDNIKLFARLHRNARIPVGDGTIFHAMETFSMRYRNVAMAGPQYWMFAPSRSALPPYVTGTRIYSCNLIRNAAPFRWRGRYNEDTDLSLRMLKRGWNTVQFNAFLQYKVTTQTLAGGLTEAFYSVEGTRPKSEMLVRMHPDVARLVHRFGRWHHYVDYSRFRRLPLIPDEDYDERPDYSGLALVDA